MTNSPNTPEAKDAALRGHRAGMKLYTPTPVITETRVPRQRSPPLQPHSHTLGEGSSCRPQHLPARFPPLLTWEGVTDSYLDLFCVFYYGVLKM